MKKKKKITSKTKSKLKAKSKKKIKLKTKFKIKLKQKKNLRKKFNFKKKSNKKKKRKNRLIKKIILKKKKKKTKISHLTRETIIKIIRIRDKFSFKLNFDLDKSLLGFFQSIANTIDSFKIILAEEKERKKQLKIKQMQLEKIDTVKKNKLEKERNRLEKAQELKDEAKLERARK